MRQVPKLKESGMSRFGLALYVSFHQTMKSVLSFVADLDKIHVPEELDTSYRELVDQLTENNNVQKARTTTGEQEEINAERNRIVSFIFYVVNNALRSTKGEMLDAAKLLETVIRPYRSVTTMAYSAETSSLRGLIHDLKKEEHSSAISTLGLQLIVDELEEENEAFDTLRKAAIDAAAAQSRRPSTAKLRTQTDDVYYEICERIYASGLLATEPDHVTLITNLINEMNGVIDCYRTTRNQMVGQRKAQSAQTPEQEPEQTPAQPEAQALQASQEGEMPNSFPLYLPYNRDLY